jgi:hypothetical protein
MVLFLQFFVLFSHDYIILNVSDLNGFHIPNLDMPNRIGSMTLRLLLKGVVHLDRASSLYVLDLHFGSDRGPLFFCNLTPFSLFLYAYMWIESSHK